MGFAVKTPLYPFHIWLPEAHSEAPTTGSVLLAGVLLKMGTYGFLRYVIPLFPDVLEYYKTLIYFMCLSGILFSSMSALAQIDIKKLTFFLPGRPWCAGLSGRAKITNRNFDRKISLTLNSSFNNNT